MFQLVIGTKKYSTWSMRPWVFMKWHDVDFRESVVPFLVKPGGRDHTAETDMLLRQVSPNSRVPVLVLEDGTRINESLSICEYISEITLGGRGWPNDPLDRAKARSVCLEMATGFTEMRRLLPMAIGSFAEREVAPPQRATKDISRITEIIENARSAYEQNGKFMFGSFTIADAMFVPVVSRFNTYRVPMTSRVKNYSETILNMRCVRDWYYDATKDGVEIGAISEIVRSYPTEMDAACKI